MTEPAHNRSSLDRIPWMTIGTLLMSGAFLLSSVLDALPARYGAIAATVIMVVGQLGRAAYQLGSNPSIVTQNVISASPEASTGDAPSDG